MLNVSETVIVLDLLSKQMMNYRNTFRKSAAAVFFALFLTLYLSAGSTIAAGVAEYSVSFNGTFVSNQLDIDCRSMSENRTYYCRYNIGAVSDEIRELSDFRLYTDGNLLYSLEKAPGSDLYISNSGIVAFMDHTYHFKGELTVHFYSEQGELLFSKKFFGASFFEFSPDGEMFGVSTPENLVVITPRRQKVDYYNSGYRFDISSDGSLVAVADGNKIYIYNNGAIIKEINTETAYPRKIRISPDNSRLSLIDKRHLKIYSIAEGSVIFEDKLDGNLSFRDLAYRGGNLECGIHFRDEEYSRGILRIYNPFGNIILQEEKDSRYIKSPPPPENLGNIILDYDPIPWPFAPFDSMCTVWNHYEQHMSYGTSDWSYLHQGLDMITPINEPTYAVQSGIVKCVLTIGGNSYWRLAISPQQNSGWSSGWLYAHLVESSIQVDVGDTVDIYDYIGNIIYWAEDWGHIHFVEIADSGLVWQYFDNQWGINFNPLLALTSDEDIFPPIFDDVFTRQKFAFSPNETVMQYQDPDSLNGDIDIIVKIRDYSGNSEWQLPAFELYYWVVSVPSGDTVLPRTLGDILNHSYDFYDSDLYEPYALLQYKRDDTLLPSPWMDTVRNYYHILTNNNGDSLAELSESQLSFHTGDYPNGLNRIYVEAYDAYENYTLDSMDVILQNYPNISYNPSFIRDTLLQGYTQNRYVTIGNTGTADLILELEAVELNSPIILNNWLFISPVADTISPGDSLTATVTLDATTVSQGDYAGEINITSNDPDTPAGIVQVNLTVIASGPLCEYVVGDANSSGVYDGLDITFSVNYFKGGTAPTYSCECTPGNSWHVSGDVNASCSYNGLDVTYGVAYFKGGPGPMPCADCPPVE